MKRILNTLYVTSGNKYLSLDGENVVVLEEQQEIHLGIQEQVRLLWEHVHNEI